MALTVPMDVCVRGCGDRKARNANFYMITTWCGVNDADSIACANGAVACIAVVLIAMVIEVSSRKSINEKPLWRRRPLSQSWS